MIKSLNDPKYPQEVKTSCGPIRGFKWRNIYHFLSVPYGQAERWQKSQPPAPWKDVLNCMEWGPVCPTFSGYKPIDDIFLARPFHNKAEACLNLNVFTPSVDPNAKKPVMFFAHGGGYSDGCAHAMYCYDGEAIADYGDVVMVSVNHRLNIFGFLDCEKYGEKYVNSGNRGMEDIVLALKWVQNNIAAFGGDPDNVTIFGQSGGGGKVTTLLQTPAADGLYHKAIAQSGICRDPQPINGKSISDVVIEGLMKRMGVDDFEEIAKLSTDELISEVEAIMPEVNAAGFDRMNWSPKPNGWYLGEPWRVGFNEYAKKVPVMIGGVIAEFKKKYPVENKDSYPEEMREKIVAELTGKDTAKLVEEYRKVWPGKNVIESLYVDAGTRTNVLKFLEERVKTCEAPSYNYMFAYSFPWDGGNLAWHSSELPFIFHNIDLYPACNLGEETDLLQNQMCSSWVNFAKTGNPDNIYMPEGWPCYSAADKKTMIFDKVSAARNADYDHDLLETYISLGLKSGPF